MSVCPFVSKLVSIIFSKNELILIPNGVESMRQRHETINDGKGQGHTRPKTDLEAWWRHHSQPLCVE